MPEDYLAFTNYKRASYIAGPWINSFKATDTSKLSSVAKLIDEYNRLGKLLSNYKGEDIQQILMDASKKLPKKEYLELFNKFKRRDSNGKNKCPRTRCRKNNFKERLNTLMA